MFSLDMKDARPMNLILTSSVLSYGTFTLNKDVNLYVSFTFIPSFSLLFLGLVGLNFCTRQLFESRFYYLRHKTSNRN